MQLKNLYICRIFQEIKLHKKNEVDFFDNPHTLENLFQQLDSTRFNDKQKDYEKNYFVPNIKPINNYFV